MVDVDTMYGCSGNEIYLCYTTDPSLGEPLTGLDVIVGSASQPASELVCPPGYDRLNQDLNEGALTHYNYVFLCVTREGYIAGVNDVENIILVYESVNSISVLLI